jgi:DNA-binding transcriptional LysR family regulator
MELRQLRHFVAIAEEMNFSGAARRVHLTQPALTRSLKALEEHLETRLLDRGPRGASLTREGELFLEYARMILHDCDRAQREIRMFRDGVAGHVSMGVATLFGGSIAFEAAKAASLELPKVELTVTEGYFEDLLGLLRTGQIDFALTNFAQPGIDDEFVVEPILELHAHMFAATGHPLTRMTPLRPQDLATFRWVVINRTHSPDVLMQYFGSFDLPPPPILKTDSLALLRLLVSDGSHLALISHGVMHDEVRSGRVRVLDVEMPAVTRRAGLIYLRARPRSGAVERLIQIVREAARSDRRSHSDAADA